MARILISGCSGFLGTYLIPLIAEEGNEVIGISDQSDCEVSCRHFVKVDLRDYQRLLNIFQNFKPEVIIHLAAISNVHFSWKHPRETVEVNLNGSQNILQAALETNRFARIYLMSSAETYRPAKRPLKENSPQQATNFYALSKLMMEELAAIYRRAYQMEIMIFRGFNFTGPGQSPIFVASDFARQIARIEFGLQAPLICVGNLEAIRDFSDVRDISYYIQQVIKRKVEFNALNLCSGKGIKIHEILEILIKLAKVQFKVKIDQDKFRPIENPIFIGDASLLREHYALKPRYDLGTTLNDLLNYWRRKIAENPDN